MCTSFRSREAHRVPVPAGAELVRLRRENRRLQQDVDVLERATAFFASMPK